MIVAKIRGKHEAQEHVSTIHYVTELTHGNGGQYLKAPTNPTATMAEMRKIAESCHIALCSVLDTQSPAHVRFC